MSLRLRSAPSSALSLEGRLPDPTRHVELSWFTERTVWNHVLNELVWPLCYVVTLGKNRS